MIGSKVGRGCSGVFSVYKPVGWTSAGVVSHIKGILRCQEAQSGDSHAKKTKVGHGGTLDKLAEGVLVIGVNEGCKMLKHYLRGSKSYMVTARLGTATTTYDSDGDITEHCSWNHVSKASLKEALNKFHGEILQQPPLYSALKVDGKRLSDYARSGQAVEIQKRRVHISEIQICYYDPPDIMLHVTCSAGVYIRSLVQDLGKELGTVAHVAKLVRIQAGDFSLVDAIKVYYPEAIILKQHKTILKCTNRFLI